MGFFTWIKGLGRRGCNAPLSFDEWLATPPPKIAAAINRHLDRDIAREIARRRGSNPPAPGNKPAAPAEMPSDEQLERWKRAAIFEHAKGGEPSFWRTIALLAFAEGRRQAQSHQIPPPGADPVATDGDLLKVLDSILRADDARRALYNLGRADERTAILRALGVEP
jgi:hypothetical protein